MNNIKFYPGDKVAYKSKTPAGINMRVTTIVGHQDVRSNPWKIQSFNKYQIDDNIYKKPNIVRTDNPKSENVYIIAHFFGWHPHVQSDINPVLDLKRNSRYYFAYESELSFVQGDKKV